MDLARKDLGPGCLELTADISFNAFAEDLSRGGDAAGSLGEFISRSASRALFWETPPTTSSTRDRPFACILQDAPALAGLRPDPSPFRRELRGPVSAFWNLGRDAVLVAPEPPGAYAHLAAFCRNAPPRLQRALWARVGVELLAWWDRCDDPVWVSTSGLGVSWLHVRLDACPKYYTHGPYRDANQPDEVHPGRDPG